MPTFSTNSFGLFWISLKSWVCTRKPCFIFWRSRKIHWVTNPEDAPALNSLLHCCGQYVSQLWRIVHWGNHHRLAASWTNDARAVASCCAEHSRVALLLYEWSDILLCTFLPFHKRWKIIDFLDTRISKLFCFMTHNNRMEIHTYSRVRQ